MSAVAQGGTCRLLRKGLAVRDAILPGTILALCWSWIGTTVPIVSGLLAGIEIPGIAVSLTMFGLNIVSLTVCAGIRRTRIPVSPRRGWLIVALVVGFVLLKYFAPPGLCAALLFAVACLGSYCTMSCLLTALEAVAQTLGSPIPVLAMAFAASGLINALVTAASGEVRTACWLLLTCLPYLLTAYVGRRGPAPSQDELPPCAPAALKQLGKPAVGSFLYGLVFMGMWCMSVGSADLAGRDRATVIQSVAICLFFVVIIAFDRISAARGKRLLESVSQRLVFSAYVVGTMVFSLVLNVSAALSSLLVMSATALFEMTLFYWAVNWGGAVRHGTRICLAVLLGSLMVGQSAALCLFELLTRPLLGAISPVMLGYACLALVMPAALAVFIPMDINEWAPESTTSANPPANKTRDAAVPIEPPCAAPDGFADLCRRLGLSPREVQVAELLASGRSLPYIQDALCISEGTAKTHLRHIYDKAGVHRRQEFLNLIQQNTSSTSSTNQS